MEFGFIGCGHMGATLASAVSKTVKDIALADANGVDKLAEETGSTKSTNLEIAKNAKYIVLGIKPQNLADLMDEIAGDIKARSEKPVVISMCAGVKIEKIESFLSKEVPIIRIMPNTPAAVGQGMIVYSTNDTVNENQKKAFELAFSKAGEIAPIKEELIDAASAIHGCGPAFVYEFILALAEAGERIGLDRELALKLAKSTVRGSGSLAIESTKDPVVLRDEVCSPGGSTIEGVKVLQASNFKEEVSATVKASFDRTKELG